MSQKKIALFDIDDTIYNGGIIFPLMESQADSGLLSKESVDTVNEHRNAYKRGDIAYEEQSKGVVISWAEGLQGVSYEVVLRHAEEFIKKDYDKFYTYTPDLLALLKETHDAVIITNEPQFVAEIVLSLFGFASYSSTTFEVKEGLLTGTVSHFNSTQHDKGQSVQKVLEGYTTTSSFAFGDSISDLQMFEAVENPVCVNASPELHAIATSREWILASPDNILDRVSQIFK